MKKSLYVLLILSLIYSCEKHGTDSPIEKRIDITLDKEIYSPNDKVGFCLQNLMDSTAYFYACNGYPKPQPYIEKYMNNKWTIYYATMCDGYRSYCCVGFKQFELIRDTIILNNFETGNYRTIFNFEVRNNNNDWIRFETKSKEFHIE